MEKILNEKEKSWKSTEDKLKSDEEKFKQRIKGLLEKVLLISVNFLCYTIIQYKILCT